MEWEKILANHVLIWSQFPKYKKNLHDSNHQSHNNNNNNNPS